MRLLSIHDNWSKQVMQRHRPFMVYCFFMVCYNFLFHLIDFENVGNGRRRNLDNFYFFFYFPKKVTVTPSKCKIYRKNKKNKSFERLPTMVGHQNFWFLEHLKMPILSF